MSVSTIALSELVNILPPESYSSPMDMGSKSDSSNRPMASAKSKSKPSNLRNPPQKMLTKM